MKNIGFVFINGAGLSAAIWDDVRARIDAPTLAIEAPHRGDKAALKLSLKEYVDEATVKAIRAGILALIRPVITSTLGRCVASTR